VINESAARRLFGDAQAAIGRGVILGAPGSEAPLRQVVGVVADVRQHAAAASTDVSVYVPYGQIDADRMHVVARFTPASVVDLPAIVALVRDVNPDVPVDRLHLLAESYAGTAGTPRFLAFLLGTLAVLGLALSMLGAYATASQTLVRRLRDLAVRAALGAGAVELFTHVLQRAMAAVAWGLAAGLLVSGVLSRFLEAYLYGIGARDSRIFALAAGLIAASALLASFTPAARAARLDPNEVLRGD
jgi:ABC-type antimicrobial peptide transport system permease subunit